MFRVFPFFEIFAYNSLKEIEKKEKIIYNVLRNVNDK